MNWNDIKIGKIKLQMADLIFTRSNKPFPVAIRIMEQGKGENASLVNHVSGVTKCARDGNFFAYSVTEAVSRVKENDLFDYQRNGDDIIILRNKYTTPASRWVVAGLVSDQIGKIYSPVRIIGQLIDKLIEKIFPIKFDFFSNVSLPFSRICSVVWSVPYSYIGVSFGVDPKTASPDEMFDYCMEHPEEWEIIFLSDGIKRLMF